MKRTTMLMLCGLTCLVAMAGKKSSAKILLDRLGELQQKGIMIGHQDALFYGTTWKWEFGRSDMKDVCGDFPAVLGCELSGLDFGKEKNIDGVPFQHMRQQIISFAQQGGIITLSWHPDNPLNGLNAWNVEGKAVEAVLPQGQKHDDMVQRINKIICFIKSLKTADGKAIPVIFRPWHEMSGDWFWWGTRQCTTEQYKALFQMTHQLFEKAHVNQVIWCYSPGADAKDTPEHYFSFYPGDAYVDLLGVDLYQFASDEEFIRMGQNEMKIMHNYSLSHHKLFALTETGYRNTPNASWFTTVLEQAVKGFRPSYILFWRNAWDKKEENFGPAPEKNCANDFRKFHDNPDLLFLSDIRTKINPQK